ncbi:MAG: hypothetical protein EOM67_16485 [Spirochaetia bacterium]|nr:hypothetical protein [Spirochaetia bacterium]
MINQVILAGRIESFHEKIVDNGTNALLVIIEIDNNLIPIWTRDDMAASLMDHGSLNSLIAVKAHIHMAPDGMSIIADRISILGEEKE